VPTDGTGIAGKFQERTSMDATLLSFFGQSILNMIEYCLAAYLSLEAEKRLPRKTRTTLKNIESGGPACNSGVLLATGICQCRRLIEGSWSEKLSDKQRLF